MLYYGLVDARPRALAGGPHPRGRDPEAVVRLRQVDALAWARAMFASAVRWRHATKVVDTAKFGERRRSAGDTNWTFVASSEEASLRPSAITPEEPLAERAAMRNVLLGGCRRAPSAEVRLEASWKNPSPSGPLCPLQAKAAGRRVLRVRGPAPSRDETQADVVTGLEAVRRRKSSSSVTRGSRARRADRRLLAGPPGAPVHRIDGEDVSIPLAVALYAAERRGAHPYTKITPSGPRRSPSRRPPTSSSPTSPSWSRSRLNS